MKTTEKSPTETFSKLLKGSATARNLTFIYVLISLTLAFKLRAQLSYVIPLLLGAILITGYGLTFLSLKKFNLKQNDLKLQIKRYKNHILKREKYESTVFFIWILTLVPAFIVGDDITIVTIIKWMVVIYILSAFGNTMFKSAIKQINELEEQLNNSNANTVAL